MNSGQQIQNNVNRPTDKEVFGDNTQSVSTGTTSMVLGILSLVMSWLYIGWILGIIAVVLSGKNTDKTQDGMATAGKVTGIIGIVLGALQILFIFLIVWMIKEAH